MIYETTNQAGEQRSWIGPKDPDPSALIRAQVAVVGAAVVATGYAMLVAAALYVTEGTAPSASKTNSRGVVDQDVDRSTGEPRGKLRTMERPKKALHNGFKSAYGSKRMHLFDLFLCEASGSQPEYHRGFKPHLG